MTPGSGGPNRTVGDSVAPIGAAFPIWYLCYLMPRKTTRARSRRLRRAHPGQALGARRALQIRRTTRHAIVRIAQKELAANQRLARVKEREAEDQRPHETPGAGAPAHDAGYDPTDQTGAAGGQDADGFEPDGSPRRPDQVVPRRSSRN
jgi:hypothetical protein